MFVESPGGEESREGQKNLPWRQGGWQSHPEGHEGVRFAATPCLLLLSWHVQVWSWLVSQAAHVAGSGCILLDLLISPDRVVRYSCDSLCPQPVAALLNDLG
jgi:hypothetical protein